MENVLRLLLVGKIVRFVRLLSSRRRLFQLLSILLVLLTCFWGKPADTQASHFAYPGSILTWQGASAMARDKDSLSYCLSGRVVNSSGEAEVGVPVWLWEDDGELSMTSKTDSAGEFVFDHEACGSLNLEVLPSLKSGYASAHMQHLPGIGSRKLIVKLRSGFLVSGRVEHEGKGIKGVIVRVSPGTNVDGPQKSHGGGAATTAKDGTFSLNLTAGSKKLTIINTKYAALKKRIEKEIVVTDAMQLGDFSL